MTDEKAIQQSGGADLSEGTTHIGGDVTGRDKLINTDGDIVNGNKTVVNTEGGAYIGGNVVVSGGKFVGRDDYSGTGLLEDDISAIFQLIYARLETHSSDIPVADGADARENIEVIEEQIKQGDQADEKILGISLKSLRRLAPDIWDVIVNTFLDPSRGIATVIRKVMEKARADASQAGTGRVSKEA